MKRICTICARGGSKGVKNKNIRDLCGKPLIVHSIVQAKETGLFGAIAVSSDSDAILETAGKWGADYLIRRPDALATDRAAKLPAIQHCVKEVEKITGSLFDIIVDLDATSPLRFASDIKEAVRLLEERGCGNLITAAPARRSPYFNLVEVTEEGFARLSKTLPNKIIRRQDSPRCFDMNASIDVCTRDVLLRGDSVFRDDTLLFVMPEERSIDIDSELDFKFVRMLMEERGGDA